MINWILQKNLTKPKDLERIKLAVEKDNAIWEEVEIIPFSDEIPQTVNKDSFKIIYGSTTLMLNAFKDEKLKQGVFYNPDTFQMKNYVDKWKDNILNSEGQLIKFGQLEELKSDKNQQWFIRPNHDGKQFSGRVDTFQELVKWSKIICDLDLPDFNSDTEVWISEPKEISKEWRLFIVDDKIVSASRYMQGGELEVSDTDIPVKMLNFAEARIKEYRLHDVYVMDIVQVEDEFKLIECNCFNGTGFYKHDIERIVRAVNDFVRKGKKYPIEVNKGGEIISGEVSQKPYERFKYLVFNHFNEGKILLSAFDAWLGRFKNKTEIGNQKPISIKQIKLGFQLDKDIKLIEKYLN